MSATVQPTAKAATQPKLLDQLRREIRLRHYSIRTEHSYSDWVYRYIVYHNKRHPAEMGAPEITAFLSYLATDLNVAASTQNQACCAIGFLYKYVLEKDLPEFGEIVRAKKPKKLPVVLSAEETASVLSGLEGHHRLMGDLLYGTGMRIIELIRLRVKDVDFDRRMIIVRSGKGQKDRVAVLPSELVPELKAHVEKVRLLHEKDLAAGTGTVHLPFALDRKYPNANKEWGWKYVFPAHKLSVDPRSGITQRHHVYESVLQKALQTATRNSGVVKPVHAHTMRHGFATHMLEAGHDIRTVQKLLGHKDVRTTMIYTHVMQDGISGVASPLTRVRLIQQQRQTAAKEADGVALIKSPLQNPLAEQTNDESPANETQNADTRAAIAEHACSARTRLGLWVPAILLKRIGYAALWLTAFLWGSKQS
ncbi:MAG: integron integrase [Lentisphaerae bacterium]|nr:integron integrase [Lentisphaerota bacterium]